jgi:hypothetical protein
MFVSSKNVSSVEIFFQENLWDYLDIIPEKDVLINFILLVITFLISIK